MSSYSKSLFTNATVLSESRSLINPIVLTFSGAVITLTGASGSELTFLTDTYIQIIRIIQENYSNKIASKNYDNVPSDYTQFVNLLNQLDSMKRETSSSAILLLLQVAEDTLKGAYNSLTLFGDNVLLELQVSELQQQVQDILSEANVETVQTTPADNSLTVTQNFQLATVFNYYIKIYGAPPNGTGFDPVKLSFLIYVLELNGIDPYA